MLRAPRPEVEVDIFYEFLITIFAFVLKSNVFKALYTELIIYWINKSVYNVYWVYICTIWNRLSADIKTVENTNLFKHQVKDHYLKKLKKEVKDAYVN